MLGWDGRNARRLYGSWQADAKGTALIYGACNSNITAMRPGNSPGQAEAEPCSRLRPTLIAAIESFENPLLIGAGHTDSRVFDGDGYVLLRPVKGNLNFSS